MSEFDALSVPAAWAAPAAHNAPKGSTGRNLPCVAAGRARARARAPISNRHGWLLLFLHALVSTHTHSSLAHAARHWDCDLILAHLLPRPTPPSLSPCIYTAGKEGKQVGVPMEPAGFVAHVQGLLAEVQAALLAQVTAFRVANIVDVTSCDELKAAVAEGGRAPGLGGVVALISRSDTRMRNMQACTRRRRDKLPGCECCLERGTAG